MAEKEYIERETLFRTIENIPDNELLGNDNTTFVELPTVLDIISEQPIADVQELRHGKWKCDGIALKCSECDECLVVEQGTADMNFCPNCGAKMDKE